ncbi:hypothetical protein B0H12DRAFT_1091254 [Mycena haematopus]|nr:hypothetical protein B0H12DRAFT_1091254 [Mycena haematopus]
MPVGYRNPCPNSLQFLYPNICLTITAKPNTLKRAFDSENHDESSAEIDLRPLKRARTQPILSPQVVSQTSAARIQSPAAALFPTRAALTDIFYPSPANSSPLKTPNKAARAPKSLRHIDFAALKPTPSLPEFSFPRPRPALFGSPAALHRALIAYRFLANDPILDASFCAAHSYIYVVPETYKIRSEAFLALA